MFLTTHAELESLGPDRYRSGRDQYRHTQHLRPIAYNRAGSLRRIIPDWADGDATFPHVISESPMLIYTAANGNRRICPTRDPLRYVEIGAPYIKPATSWQRVSLGTAERSGHTITWRTGQAIVKIAFAGFKVDLDVELLAGWQPPNGQVAFPVDMQGLTRTGTTFYADGAPVLTLRPMQMIDAANPQAAPRPVATELVQVSSQWYALATLPDLAGMVRPTLDPTLTLQPDATDSKDTRIIQSSPTINLGISNALSAGEYNGAPNDARRSLIAFNLASLPDTAIISSATLTLTLAALGSTYADNNRTMRIYRTKRAWLEGTRNAAEDNPATGATWNRYDTTSTWQTAGGFGANDCEQTSIGSHAMATTDAANSAHDFPLTAATKAALDLGNGWMLKADTETNDLYDFWSSDDTTAGTRPKLVVAYTMPGAATAGYPYYRRPF